MVRYVCILLNSMLVACPSQPKASKEPNSGLGLPSPLVRFENAPSDNSTETTLAIKVKGANSATIEYAYAFVPRAGVNCHSQKYGSWRKFSQSIHISANAMGAPGKKTLCAKGRRQDKTDQQEPTKHEWILGGDGDNEQEEEGAASLTIALDTDSSETEEGGSHNVKVTVAVDNVVADTDKNANVILNISCDEGLTVPHINSQTAEDGKVVWDNVSVPTDKEGECKFTAQAMLSGKVKESETATFTINEAKSGSAAAAAAADAEHTLELTDEEKQQDNTANGLQLSQKTLKFASTSKDVQTVMLENTGSANIGWQVTTDHEEVLFKVQKKDATNWTDLKQDSVVEGTLSTSATQELQFRLARLYKTDYNGDQKVIVKISDSTNNMTLTLHILAPKLNISADEDTAITKQSGVPIWHVVLTNSDKEKTLTIANTKKDLQVLDWDVFPYMWKPSWFTYEIDEEAGTLQLKLEKKPEAEDNKKITLIIASNSDSHDIKARSFALFDAGKEVTWYDAREEEKQQQTKAKWRTYDIRYVVVVFEEEEE